MRETVIFRGESGEGAEYVKEIKWKGKDVEHERQVNSKKFSSDSNVVEEKRGFG